MAPPQLDPKPALQPVALADHRWARKAGRFRDRMLRRTGNLEVRYERKDARREQRLLGKVRRIARKLDDPTFVDEHPMLRRARGEA